MILYILGNLVLLNLFLAILLSNFDPANTEVEVPDEEEQIEEFSRFKLYAIAIKLWVVNHCGCLIPDKEESDPETLSSIKSNEVKEALAEKVKQMFSHKMNN